MGLEAEVLAADIDETPLAGEGARDYVLRVAQEKAGSVQRSLPPADQRIVIAADTSVVLGSQILGKPSDAEVCERMLSALSGTEHAVMSAVVVTGGHAPPASRLVETRVWMRETNRAERAAYWASGEPAGKAGGYAIQGLGATLIERIEGNYATVVGLPVFELSTLLALHGINLLSAPGENK